MGTAPVEVSRKGHIFFSHAGADTPAARQLVEELRHNGLDVWFDKDSPQYGDNWMATIEKAISSASAMIVYVGSLGIQAWVDREVRFGLVRNTANPEAFRLIPVLGEGADLAKLPPFVQQQQCVDVSDRQGAPEKIRRLVETLRSSSSQTAVPAKYWTTHSPFRSLRTFGQVDSWLFFGRDRDTEELLTRLGRAPTLAVIGASGSGKSSLVEAGLIPALRRGRFRYGGNWVDSWRIAVFRPSAKPFDFLANALPQLAPELSQADREASIDRWKKKLPEGGEALGNAIAALMSPTDPASEGTHVLLVADQIEELFTLVSDQATRARYIDSLLAAAGLDRAVPVHLVLTLRADFYAHCLKHAELGAALGTNLYNVLGITPPQLREGIENRLALAAAGAEAGLIDSLLADVGEEPGNLALLEHALAQLWDKCGGSERTLTGGAYAEIGRLKRALGRHADEVYRDLGSEADQQLAQKIFLELVQLGDGAQDTRRRVPKEELLYLGAPEEVERVIAKLASGRLLATSGKGLESPSENFVEVSHETLIREWPALLEWLDHGRENLRLGRLLLEAAKEWSGMQEDASALIHGARLAKGRAWLAGNRAPPLVQVFLKASGDAEEEAERRERESREREIARQKELRQMAERLREQSTELSRGLAAQAEQAIAVDQSEALTVAMRGRNMSQTAEANLALARTFPQLLATLSHRNSVVRAVFSPNGQRIVTASMDHTARLWNAASGKELARLEGHEDRVLHAAFSADGQRIVTASRDKTARVWNVADGQPVLWKADNGQMLDQLQGHADSIGHAAFSPNGQRIVTASDDNTAGVWSAASGQLLAKLTGHTDSVVHGTFSPDGQRIVTASLDSTAWVWNVAGGEPLAKLTGHTDGVVHGTFSPDGQRIVTASLDHTARVWDAANGQLLAQLGHTGSVWHAAFSTDGRQIVTASDDNTARVWNASGGELLAQLEGHEDGVLHAGFSTDGRRIVTASRDDTARVWNASSGQLLANLKFVKLDFDMDTDKVKFPEPDAGTPTNIVVHAAFSPDGQRIVTGSTDCTARVWNLGNGQLLATLKGPRKKVECMAFSPDLQRIVIARMDHTVNVWNVANGQQLAEIKGHTAVVLHVAFSADGQRIVTAGEDKTARVWNAANGELVAEIKGHRAAVVHAAFSPDGQRVVTASKDHTARLWDAANGQLITKLGGHAGELAHAAFSSDGQRVVTAGEDKTARVWNAANGELVAEIKGHTAVVVHAEFSPGGQRVVTASRDQTARVWDAANGQPLARLEGHKFEVRQAAFSPNGQRIVTVSDDTTARVWNATGGSLLGELEGHTGSVVQGAFSPDGQSIVTASLDRTARVWNAADGKLLAKLEGHEVEVRQAAFSPDGQRVVTANVVGTVRVYRVVTLSEIAELLGK